MKKKIGFFIFCLIPVLCNAQLTGLAYQKKSFELDSLLTIARDTNKYIMAFEKLPAGDLLESDIFKALQVYAKLKNADKAKYYANKSMAKGQSSQLILAYLNPYLSQNEKKLLLYNECALKKQYLDKVSKDLYEEINSLALVDGKIRELYNTKKVDTSVINKLDFLNVLNIKAIIEKYGMITERKHGALFYVFYSVLLHSSIKNPLDYEQIQKPYFEAVVNGDSKATQYAYFVDKYENETNGEQVYGSFANPKTGLGIVRDVKNVDRRRAAIGASTLKTWFIYKHVDLKFLPADYGK